MSGPEHGPAGGQVVETGCKRRDGRIQRLPCGCTSDDFVWLTLCEQVARSHVERHTRSHTERNGAAHKAEPLLE